MHYNFEWDPAKAKSNRIKHKVSFEQASSIFKDPQAITIYDDSHSSTEDRWITIGIAANMLLLVVHHTYKQISAEMVIIRIISSRKATRQEQIQYREA